LPLAGAAAAFAAVAGLAMWRRRYQAARAAAIAQVGCILLAWAVAQTPLLVPPTITIEGSASEPEVMAALLITMVIGAALLLPSLALLFYVFKGRNPAAN
jgi:cytochrome d ubiquinol oxidase subunit II